MNKIVIAEQTHKWVERCEELQKENAQLKELLKECRGSIATLLAKRITEVNSVKQKELLTKIDEVLK